MKTKSIFADVLLKKESNEDKIESFKEKKRNQILMELGFLQFSKKNEKDYLDDIKQINILLEKDQETIKKNKSHFDSIKRNLAKQIENLNREIEKKDNSIKEYIIIEGKIKLELEELKISTKNEINQIKKEKKEIEDENKSQKKKIEDSEKSIKELEEKLDRQFTNLFNLQLSLKEIEKVNEEIKQQNQTQSQCCICMEGMNTYACVPCGHKKYCEKCITNIQRCSICKQLIREKVKIYE